MTSRVLKALTDGWMRVPAGAGLALLLAGCAAPAGAAAGVVPPDGDAWRFAPSGPAAERYAVLPESSPRNAQLDNLLASVTVAIRRVGRPVPSWDERLAAVARDVASVAPATTALGYSVIEFAMHHHGIVEPTPHLVVFWGKEEVPQLLPVAARVEELAATTLYARVGIGVSRRRDQRVVVIALLASSLELEPVPRVVPRAASVRVQGRVLPPFGDPVVLVAREATPVEPVAVDHGPGGRFTALVSCAAERGAMRVEVSAASERGGAVLANFPIFCGLAPPDALLVRSPPEARLTPSDVEAAEQRLVDLINHERVRAGLQPLGTDTAVAGVARRYCAEMAETGVVAHISALSGTAMDRLRAAGLQRAVVQENLARAASIDEAHQSLMNSPGHRANVLSPAATHLGVGVATGPNGDADLLVTELFVRVPPPLEVAAARADVSARLAASRLSSDPELDRLAQEHASRLARGESHGPPDLQSLGDRYSNMRTLIVAVGDLGQLASEDLPVGEQSTHIGLGLAQGRHPKIGEAAIWVVVLLGRHR